MQNQKHLRKNYDTQNQITEPGGRKSVRCFIPSRKGVPMDEAIFRAEKAGLVIASNRLLRIPRFRYEWNALRPAYPNCLSGTMVGFVKPGEKFGSEIVTDYLGLSFVFPVPAEYRGARDALLVAEHPDYTLIKDGKSRIVQAARVGLIERFPAKEGLYMGDRVHRIPYGEQVPRNSIDFDDWALPFTEFPDTSGAIKLIRSEQETVMMIVQQYAAPYMGVTELWDMVLIPFTYGRIRFGVAVEQITPCPTEKNKVGG